MTLPTIWTRGKQRWEESERRRKEVRGLGKRKNQKKEGAGARKGRKVVIHGVFSHGLWLQRVEGRLAKAAGAEPSGQKSGEQV